MSLETSPLPHLTATPSPNSNISPSLSFHRLSCQHPCLMDLRLCNHSASSSSFCTQQGDLTMGKSNAFSCFYSKDQQHYHTHIAVKLCLCTIVVSPLLTFPLPHPLPVPLCKPHRAFISSSSRCSSPHQHLQKRGFSLPIPASPTNLPTQFLFILAVSAESAFLQRHLLQSPTPSPISPCLVSQFP